MVEEAKFKTVNIKGKEYVEVNERVKFFRKEYEGWRIVTELISNENGVCVFKASIKNWNDETVSTGYAYEKEEIVELQPCSNKTIAESLNWEINRVTGRVNELAKKGLIKSEKMARNGIGRLEKLWEVKEEYVWN